LEEPADWYQHREGILENLSPVGHLEFTLAERVALLFWRLHRVNRYETETIALSQEQVEEDVHGSRRFVSASGKGSANTHPQDIRFRAQYDKRVHDALRRFASHPAEKIFEGGGSYLGRMGSAYRGAGEDGQEIDVEELDLPGVPETPT
jgi:hypothetical protein